MNREIERCRFKLALCVRNARQASRDSRDRTESAPNRREYRKLKTEAMDGVCGARYWRDKLRQELKRAESLGIPG